MKKKGWSSLTYIAGAYSYIGEVGIAVTLFEDGRMTIHRSLGIQFDERNNPVEGFDAADGMLSFLTMGLVTFGNENNPIYHNCTTL